MAVSMTTSEPLPSDLAGPQPVDALVRRALAENRGVQAAMFRVLAMRDRIPQVTALEDPMLQNAIWPFPSNAPQYSLMGYNPHQLMLTQQFPWAGTLALRGKVAEQEVCIALQELAAAQLEVVARVKRAYYELYLAERRNLILTDNRILASDFVEVAGIRYSSGATTQQDVLRAENAVTEIESELIEVRQSLAEARAALARELHVSPDAEFATQSSLSLASVPTHEAQLYQLAVAVRPELKAQLAAIVRDEREIELARKKYYPDIQLGLSYMLMSRDNNPSPIADGRDNYGLLVGFNLPIYRRKLDAGVREAEARAIADAKRYEDMRDETLAEVKELIAETRARREVIDLFRESYLPRAQQTLKLAAGDYRTGNQDFLTLITAWRELLQVELQIAQFESELGKALASLERTVGAELSTHPSSALDLNQTVTPQPPVPSGPGPFRSPNTENELDEPAPHPEAN
jgi:outer membrane protein TolC